MSVFMSVCLSESVLVCQSAFFSLIFVVVLFLTLRIEKEKFDYLYFFVLFQSPITGNPDRIPQEGGAVEGVD